MFKTTKTQFAIRKLAKGATAVLLSFGVFSWNWRVNCLSSL
ncbi:YSIRK-type signal peptide-containing protein [Lactobacillus kitasatonis]|nr:YSIRK-type signal peptide-containing protein [Lactobacillus kitasatonis]